MPNTSIHELKDRIAAAFGFDEILDLLQMTEREALDYLEEAINEHRLSLLKALS